MANNVNQSVNAKKDKNAKIVILVLTIVFSVVFIILGVAIRPRSASDHSGNGVYSVSGSLYTGSNSVYVSGTNKNVYYSFVPSSSGTYSFYSTNGSSSMDPAAILYNSSWSTLTSNEDSLSSRNFSISRYLTSGETYYLAVYLESSPSSSSTQTVTVYVERT